MVRSIGLALIVLAIVAGGEPVPATGGDMTDFIFINGKIWTGNPGQPWAEALIVRGDRVHAVGQSVDVQGLAGPGAKTIDCRGRLVLPGFIDSHAHFLTGGSSLYSVQLRDARGRDEFAARLRAKAAEMEKGAWILNGEWDHEKFSPPELPRRDWIDSATPFHPVCVNRLDGHMVLVNSLALKLAGITKETPDPEGGEIVRDRVSGEPTGILKDAAVDLVLSVIPEPSFRDKRDWAETALRHAAQNGVTSIHDMSDASSFEVYQDLRREDRLTARLAVYIPVTEVDLLIRLKLKSPFGDGFLKLAGLKGFVDGSLGSATAYFFEPYTDDPGTSGLLVSQMFPEGIMEKRILEADGAGIHVAIHAIGDKANALLLDIFERAEARNGSRDRRFRIEHAQHLRPGDIPRFGKLGVIASVQPYHAIDDGRWAEKKIGRGRCRTTYPFRSFLDGGAVLALGSDWPVAPLVPLEGIYAAVTRRTLDGKNPGGWFPEQKISVEEAVRGYTRGGAYAEFAEKEKGTLEAGKFADLIILDRDIFSVAPETIREARVMMTVVAGKVVHQKS